MAIAETAAELLNNEQIYGNQKILFLQKEQNPYNSNIPKPAEKNELFAPYHYLPGPTVGFPVDPCQRGRIRRPQIPAIAGRFQL